MIGRNVGNLLLPKLIPMKITDYFLTPKDIREFRKSITRRDLIGYALVLVVLVLSSKLLSFEGGVFITFLFSLFYWHIDSRFSIKCAIVCFVAVPIFLIISKHSFTVNENWAERVAVWAFYFLSIGVIKQIWEYMNESKIKSHKVESVEKRKNE